MMYYTLQGILFYTMLYVITNYVNNSSTEKDKVNQYLQQNGISFTRYFIISLLPIIKRVIIEELFLRWIIYHKICSSIFSQNTGIIVYIIIGYLFIQNKLYFFVDKLIWLIQLALHLYIYKSTGTLWCPIIVGIYGCMIKLF